MSARLQTGTASENYLVGFETSAARDASGSRIFSIGEAGAAHVSAHRYFDAGHYKAGRQWLGEWLERRSGSGSDWVHLQFHMALFELATGDWNAAYGRFLDEILPVAATTELALTDAPALLWRLAISDNAAVDPPAWEALRRTALRRMQRPAGSFLTLHNLLALAGAGDIGSIGQWLEARTHISASRDERVLVRMARAFIASIAGEFQLAGRRLRSISPALRRLGGSQAQNQLFVEIERWWWRRAAASAAAGNFARAA